MPHVEYCEFCGGTGERIDPVYNHLSENCSECQGAGPDYCNHEWENACTQWLEVYQVCKWCKKIREHIVD